MAKKRVKQTKKSNSNYTKHAPTGLYLVAIAAIVAMVAMVTLFTDTDTTSMSLSEEDLAGQAVQPVTEPCTETDGGRRPLEYGTVTGTYPWGGTVTVPGVVGDQCRDNNNQKVQSCTNCKHTEYFCRNSGHLFWNIRSGVDCEDGEIVDTGCTIAPATVNELEDYPEMFNGTNSTFNGELVVGDSAPAEDVLAITDIAMGLQDEGYIIQSVRLDSEVSDVCDQNIITVGDVCENTVIQDILGYNAGNCNDAYNDLSLDSDEAYIGLHESDEGEVYLVVTGEDPLMRRAAVYEVVDHNHPDFEGQYMIYQQGWCEQFALELEAVQENLDDINEEFDNRIFYLDYFTMQFTTDLNAVLDSFVAASNEIDDVQDLILNFNGIVDITNLLDDILDEMDDALEDLEDIIDDIENEGYDEEPFEDSHDDFQDQRDQISSIRGDIVIQC